MRIVGEPVYFTNDSGNREEINGAVFIPESYGTVNRVDGEFQYREASLILPGFYSNFQVGSTVEVRGESFRVDRPPVDHRSMFGTNRGGTELYLRRPGP